MATIYSFDELADLARKNEIPQFAYAKYERSKELLLNYPRSLRNWEHAALLPLMLGSCILIAGLVSYLLVANPFKLHELYILIPVAIAAVLTCSLFSLGIWKLMSRAGDHIDDKRRLDALGEWLGKLCDITGYAPGQLVGMQEIELRYAADTIIVEACMKVITCQEQHAEDDPTAWRPEQQKLMDDLKRKYNTFICFDLVTAGGYSSYFRDAKLRLAS